MDLPLRHLAITERRHRTPKVTPMILGHEVVGTVLIAAADGGGPAADTPVAVHPGAGRGRPTRTYATD